MTSSISSKIWSNPLMSYRMVHEYRGPVKLVIFDWAGTVVDCGVFAPVQAFTNVFAQEGIDVLVDEVRAPMGAHKRVHISRMVQMDRIAATWKAKKGEAPNEDDVERMYRNFLPEQIKALESHANVITGIPDTIRQLREDYGIRIGTSTGFTSEIMEHLTPRAAQQGFDSEFVATSDLVKEARPTPSLIFLNMINLNVHPVQAVVKVDDTITGITAGLAAGCWTVGVARTGNYMSATEDELSNMDKGIHDQRLKKAYKILIDSGAHYVIDSVNDIVPVINDINRRLALGEKP
ncbi:phosphonoacetaldehyde hydrolase-like [Lytechinus pictus]|uniref:phosphonoacetaldehyde hydrolase-like n=1 Tax=Lytechinus pictus TaxID=7653 RepID=UPI0030B9DECE